MAITKIKTIRSHVGLSRYLNDMSKDIPLGYIPRHWLDIRTPYSYSPTIPIWQHDKDDRIIFLETAHRKYEIFQVSSGQIMYSDHLAEEEYIKHLRESRGTNKS
jgi:hypothetical protein